MDWGRVADGIGLAGLGVFLLLATTKGLPRGFWIDALTFWPVLLVSAGIRLVFERTRVPWGVVLGPVVILGTLVWLAWGERPALPAPGDWKEWSADRTEAVESATIRAHLAGARLHVDAQPLPSVRLAEGRSASRHGRTRFALREHDEEATVDLQGGHVGFVFAPQRKETWELVVPSELPLCLDVGGAVLAGEVDLRRGQLIRGEVNGVLHAFDLRLPRPRETVPIRIGGVFNAVLIQVPEDVPVQVKGNPGFPFNVLDRGPAGDALPEAEPGYEVEVHGVFNWLTIEEGPPLEAFLPAEAPAAAPTMESGNGPRRGPVEAPPVPPQRPASPRPPAP